MRGRKEESTGLSRPTPASRDLFLVFASLPKIILKRFSYVPWISNTTENDFIWFYFQKVVANQLSAKVAMTPFHKLPKDNISVSFLTNRLFAPFLFCSLNVLRMKAITKEVIWSTCIYLNSKTVWLPLIELQNSLAKLNNVPHKRQGRLTVLPNNVISNLATRSFPSSPAFSWLCCSLSLLCDSSLFEKMKREWKPLEWIRATVVNNRICTSLTSSLETNVFCMFSKMPQNDFDM